MSRQFQFAHGNFNLLTAVSICSRQFQFAHGSFNFAHGNFNLPTAVSICSRQFQFRSRQFQFAHGSFNLLTAVSISLTAVSISLMMKLQWIPANIGHAGCQVLWEFMKYVAKLLITFVTWPTNLPTKLRTLFRISWNEAINLKKMVQFFQVAIDFPPGSFLPDT